MVFCLLFDHDQTPAAMMPIIEKAALGRLFRHVEATGLT
jgi:hypothetical protein